MWSPVAQNWSRQKFPNITNMLLGNLGLTLINSCLRSFSNFTQHFLYSRKENTVWHEISSPFPAIFACLNVLYLTDFAEHPLSPGSQELLRSGNFFHVTVQVPHTHQHLTFICLNIIILIVEKLEDTESIKVASTPHFWRWKRKTKALYNRNLLMNLKYKINSDNFLTIFWVRAGNWFRKWELYGSQLNSDTVYCISKIVHSVFFIPRWKKTFPSSESIWLGYTDNNCQTLIIIDFKLSDFNLSKWSKITLSKLQNVWG